MEIDIVNAVKNEIQTAIVGRWIAFGKPGGFSYAVRPVLLRHPHDPENVARAGQAWFFEITFALDDDRRLSVSRYIPETTILSAVDRVTLIELMVGDAFDLVFKARNVADE